jgi:hypothetical protein
MAGNSIPPKELIKLRAIIEAAANPGTQAETDPLLIFMNALTEELITLVESLPEMAQIKAKMLKNPVDSL